MRGWWCSCLGVGGGSGSGGVLGLGLMSLGMYLCWLVVNRRADGHSRR